MAPSRSALLAPTLALAALTAMAAGCSDDAPAAGGNDDAAIARGEDLSRTRGCAACHGADGQGGLGPAWTGVMGTEVTFVDGSTAIIDEAYLTESIVAPDAKIVAGFAIKMPVTGLTDAEVADIVAYIVSLSE